MCCVTWRRGSAACRDCTVDSPRWLRLAAAERRPPRRYDTAAARSTCTSCTSVNIIVSIILVHYALALGGHFGIRYDTRCYFNVRSKADISQLNLPHGTDN